ncbi:uncharacterized protein PHACADRAFT_260702 [Phanerochaete carnosa HHB-10118-sp]|uniref:Uncharacterized protein n=1 Tax=Phanerochaete carnosa (strain HHB-10118-sp) TaxID=650164 RepID=K5WPX2_PHACS|nr:uncharacterized protein PHACADRAFT_260702 [Phanerochaete carnosa HHB-10118-sp]EKM52377.1 hypothetical protein PHACADRAFT_260702 [Phanerochaete carnosa HHB-10118-sp]
MTRRSWTQSLLARATLTVHQGTGVEIRLGDEFEKYKTQTLQEAVALVSPLPSLFEKEVIAAPRPCVVKGTGVACPPSSKAVHPAADSTNEIPQVKSTDGKRSSCGSEASVYSQASVTSTLTELANLDSTHFSEPDDSVPSIMVQSCDSPSSKFSSHSSLSSLQTPPSPDSPSFAFCRQSPRKEYLQVPPSRILGSTRPRARPPSFASSRGTSHAMGRRRALEHANGVARGRGKENAHAGRTTPEKAKAAPVFIPCPTRNKGFSAPKAPLAVKERARDVPASSPWPF